MSSKIPLGRLEKVTLRDCWEREDTGFTPWLASEENIGILGDAIGFELEVLQEEAAVGPFRADILCKDTARDEMVIIENQLERTDHTHLGQTLVYAAGLDAVTVIWIAERFTEEHRAALDWLNRITDEGFSFFGLEIEVWRIGQSKPAPKFNLVATPNDWSKSVKKAATSVPLTPSDLNRIAYWTALGKFLESKKARFKRPKPHQTNWMGYGIGRSGASMYISLNLNNISIAVQTSNQGHPSWYKGLEDQRSDIESEIGFTLTWEPRPEMKNSLIWVGHQIDTREESNWPEIHNWFYEKMDALDNAMRQRVRSLEDKIINDEVSD